MFGKFIAGDFITIADEMRRFPASNENTAVFPRKQGSVNRVKDYLFLLKRRQVRNRKKANKKLFSS